MGAHLADEWMHDENFPLLYFEKGCGRYQRQKYVGWTRNSWKLLETVSPQVLASGDKSVHLIVCLADKLFLRHAGKIACMHRGKESSEQLGPIIVILCTICNCAHEETPTHSNHNICLRQDDDVVKWSQDEDRAQCTTGPWWPAFTDRYCYKYSTIMQIKILEFAELMVSLETESSNELYPVQISIFHYLQFPRPRPARRKWRNYFCDEFTGDVLRCCKDVDIWKILRRQDLEEYYLWRCDQQGGESLRHILCVHQS